MIRQKSHTYYAISKKPKKEYSNKHLLYHTKIIISIKNNILFNTNLNIYSKVNILNLQSES